MINGGSTYRGVIHRHWPVAVRALPWLLVTVGALLRLAQYLHNRSLWIDECFLALATADQSITEIFQPLSLNQAAPVGYLFLQKIAVSAWGSSEYVLRLIPLIAGLASLPLFWSMARHFVSGTALWFALGLFATSDSLIYYSSEAKQYSSDVTVALSCYLLAEHLGGELPVRRLLGVGVLGALLVWFSHPAIFVLSGIALSYTLGLGVKGEWKCLGRHTLVFATWAVSFALLYHFHLSHASANAFLHKYWAFAYMPLDGFPTTQASWLMRMSAGLFYMLTLSWQPVPVMIAGVGVAVLWQRSRLRCLLLVSPLLAVLVASGLHKYPFNGRLILFLTPNLTLLLAATIEAIARRSATVGVVSMALLLAHPVAFAFDRLIDPRERADTRAVVAYVLRNVQDEDVVYAGWEAQFHVDYYVRLAGADFNYYVCGTRFDDEDTGPFLESLASLRGSRRVWVILSSVLEWDPSWTPKPSVEEAKILDYLNASGTQLRSFRTRGAAVFLYDLSQTSHPQPGSEPPVQAPLSPASGP